MSSAMLPSLSCYGPAALSPRAAFALHTPHFTLQGAKRLPASERACIISGIPIRSLSQSVQYIIFSADISPAPVREVALH